MPCSLPMSNNSLVAYCGLFCGNCIIRRGQIGELSAKLLQIMETPDFQKLAHGLPKLMPDQFRALERVEEGHRFLEALGHLDCQEVCKQGGGTTGCKIRECCQEKGIEGCWCCPQMESCKALDWLCPVNGDAHIRNLRILRDQGMAAFLSGDKNW
jgi:hypothetical protein